MKVPVFRHPSEWPEALTTAVAVCLLLAFVYVVRPQNVGTFIKDILEDLEGS